jgi:hypothetical protein
MIPAQHQLIAWCEHKIEEVASEGRELRESYEHARKQKWKTATLKRHADLADKRVVFYQKMLEALKHGYIVVPNFPVEIFAIRTNRSEPNPDDDISSWARSTQFIQFPEKLPQGEGDYKNPFPIIYSEKIKEENSTGQEVVKFHSWPTEWNTFEFPLNMAKPKIMEATTRAMALKLFDDLGVFPGVRTKADPVIIGRLIDPRTMYMRTPRCVSFMIAWHLDTKVLYMGYHTIKTALQRVDDMKKEDKWPAGMQAIESAPGDGDWTDATAIR